MLSIAVWPPMVSFTWERSGRTTSQSIVPEDDGSALVIVMRKLRAAAHASAIFRTSSSPTAEPLDGDGPGVPVDAAVVRAGVGVGAAGGVGGDGITVCDAAEVAGARSANAADGETTAVGSTLAALLVPGAGAAPLEQPLARRTPTRPMARTHRERITNSPP